MSKEWQKIRDSLRGDIKEGIDRREPIFEDEFLNKALKLGGAYMGLQTFDILYDIPLIEAESDLLYTNLTGDPVLDQQ